MSIFNEDSLREAIVDKWGEYGAHVEVFDHMLKLIKERKMVLYVTSKNNGPSYSSDPLHLMYLGTSLDEAKEAVGRFIKYEREESQWPMFPHVHTVLPRDMGAEMVKFYMADGWWYSIFKVELKEK